MSEWVVKEFGGVYVRKKLDLGWVEVRGLDFVLNRAVEQAPPLWVTCPIKLKDIELIGFFAIQPVPVELSRPAKRRSRVL